MKIIIIICLLFTGCVADNKVSSYFDIKNIKLFSSINEFILYNSSNEKFIIIEDNNSMIDKVIEKQLLINLKYQETNYYCSCACVQMMLELFDIFITQDQLAIEMNTNSTTGTLDKNVAYVLNEYLFNGQPNSIYDNGYRVESINEDSFDIQNLFYKRVIDNINTGYPTVLQFNMNSLYNDGRNVNHQVLIIGYKIINDELDSLIIVDPYPDTAGIHIYKADLIFKSMIESVEPAYIW